MCLLELWFSLGICLGLGLLGHMVLLFLAFLRNLHKQYGASIVAVLTYVSSNSI